MSDRITLTDQNAGIVVGWVNQKMCDPRAAVMRGGPKGGSIGASVGIRDAAGRREWAEPGDTLAVGMANQVYIADGPDA